MLRVLKSATNNSCLLRFFIRYFIEKIENFEFRKYKHKALKKTEQYLKTMGCRRLAIISYFDSSVKNVGGYEMCCDNCKERYCYIFSCMKYHAINSYIRMTKTTEASFCHLLFISLKLGYLLNSLKWVGHICLTFGKRSWQIFV